ncbi:hypothetical protein G5V65_05865 [Rhodobacter sp. HX-7-19]|uniref:Uncharacterized protein n=1 Tax=Paragemmobacter kunshanensis TaxID=2583234 RepID=A0A6M1U2S0_9RHOB|nr:hypothetical protein [Rhodobacter kunshanensis]NGQ90415.1 hypothetical protein [Rhodobacter kunshanensis]
MSDPNMDDFYKRVGRIEQAHALGYGFEAPDTLGRSFYRRLPVRRRPVFRIGIFLFCFCFGMKGAIHYHMGADSFDRRVADIEARGGFDAVQGFLMRADPVTVLISDGISLIVERSRV